MRTKNLCISISLFVIFIASSLLMGANASTGVTSQENDVSYNGSNSATINSQSGQRVQAKFQQTTPETSNITAYTIDDQGVIIGDQAVSTVWDYEKEFDVSEYKFDTTQGYVKALHDSYYIYFLFAFPSDFKWVAMELDANVQNCMVDGHDGWVFGNSSIEGLSYYGDVSFAGDSSHPVVDARNDLSFERITDSATGLTFVEMKRALDTSDTAGKDIIFQDNTVYTVKFASPSAHKQGTRNVFTLGLSSEALNITATNTEPSITTTPRPIGEVKAGHLDNILIWGSVGFFFNIILVNLLIVYSRRS